MIRPALVLVALAVPAAATALAAGGGPSPGVIQGGNGVLSPNGKVRYVAVAAGGGTAVEAVRVHGGIVGRVTSIRGTYGVPLVAQDGTSGGLSADGRTLVLATYPALPGAQATTRFAVIDTKRFRLRRVVTLKGSYSYDAISPNGASVFVIEYVSYEPTSNAVAYRVRALDATTGRLALGAIVDKREPDESMQGFPVTRAPGRDGWAYTLYARNGAGKAFVHALDTRHSAAFCIDLPWANSTGALWNVRMTLSPDGSQLVLRQPPVGRLAVIDTKTFRVQALRKPVAPGAPIP
jgi:hypothetical protein